MPNGVLPATAQYQTVTSSSAKFAAAMAFGEQYVFTTTTDCWITTAATGGSVTASAAGAMFVAAGSAVLLTPDDDGSVWFVHIIRDSADGKASLTRAI